MIRKIANRTQLGCRIIQSVYLSFSTSTSSFNALSPLDGRYAKST